MGVGKSRGGRDTGARRGYVVRGAVVTMVAGLLGAGGWVVFDSELLAVDRVEVTGNDLVSRERVVAAAGVAHRTPLARLDVSEVRARVTRIREVETAVVQRRWPSAVRVAVRERRPVAVAGRDGRYRHVDSDGVIVLTTKRRPPGLPTLLVAEPGPRDDPTGAALEVLGHLPEPVRERLRAVEASDAASVTLQLGTGEDKRSGKPITVVWGGVERSAEKSRVLRRLLRGDVRGRDRTIDISSPEVVTTR